MTQHYNLEHYKKDLCNYCKSNKFKYILNYTNYRFSYLCKFCLKDKLKFYEQIGGTDLLLNYYKINN
jgi:superfamily II helicase